jgi:hypothetical protein
MLLQGKDYGTEEGRIYVGTWREAMRGELLFAISERGGVDHM